MFFFFFKFALFSIVDFIHIIDEVVGTAVRVLKVGIAEIEFKVSKFAVNDNINTAYLSAGIFFSAVLNVIINFLLADISANNINFHTDLLVNQ